MSFGQAASVESRCAMLSAVSLVTQLETGPNSQAERYTAVVLDADVVAVVLDRGLERWLRSDFSRSARKASSCSSQSLLKFVFLMVSGVKCLQLPSVAFSCLQLQWPSWPSVSILGVLPSLPNALGDDGGCTIQICTDPYSQLMSTAIIPGPGELQFYQRNLSGLGSLGMACAAAFSS